MKPASEGFLSRWSRLKREAVPDAAAGPVAVSDSAPVAAPDSATDAASTETAARADRAPAGARSTAASQASPVAGAQSVADPVASLPPIDSLSMESDFAPFFQPRVPETLRRAALKKLFADPHFNVMDGLDTYIDDYSKPDPLPEGWLEKIAHARDLIDHPSNRVPVDETVAAAGGDVPDLLATERADAASPAGAIADTPAHTADHGNAMRDPALPAPAAIDTPGAAPTPEPAPRLVPGPTPATEFASTPDRAPATRTDPS